MIDRHAISLAVHVLDPFTTADVKICLHYFMLLLQSVLTDRWRPNCCPLKYVTTLPNLKSVSVFNDSATLWVEQRVRLLLPEQPVVV